MTKVDLDLVLEVLREMRQRYEKEMIHYRLNNERELYMGYSERWEAINVVIRSLIERLGR